MTKLKTLMTNMTLTTRLVMASTWQLSSHRLSSSRSTWSLVLKGKRDLEAFCTAEAEDTFEEVEGGTDAVNASVERKSLWLVGSVDIEWSS